MNTDAPHQISARSDLRFLRNRYLTLAPPRCMTTPQTFSSCIRLSGLMRSRAKALMSYLLLFE